MSFSLDLEAKGCCAGCGWKFDDWEARTKDGHRVDTQAPTKSGETAYTVECSRRCSQCLSTRVRVTLRIGYDP